MKFYIADVFAEEKYEGNPLAALIPDRAPSPEEMLKIAKEINFSETSFIMSGKGANGGYKVRIFTPDAEIPFAGHPALGSAHVINQIFERGGASRVILNLPVGPIAVDISGDMLVMAQNEPQFGLVVERRAAAAGALGIKAGDISADYPLQVVSTGLPSFVVPLKSVEAVSRCAVHRELFRRFLREFQDCNVLVFALENAGETPCLRVRVFMNDCGFLEDPATGSANGNLAGYLLKYGFFGKQSIEYQARQGLEMGRPSRLYVSARAHEGGFNIRVGGKVRPVAEGRWL